MKKLIFGLYYLHKKDLIGTSWRDSNNKISVIMLESHVFYTRIFSNFYIQCKL